MLGCDDGYTPSGPAAGTCTPDSAAPTARYTWGARNFSCLPSSCAAPAFAAVTGVVALGGCEEGAPLNATCLLGCRWYKPAGGVSASGACRPVVGETGAAFVGQEVECVADTALGDTQGWTVLSGASAASSPGTAHPPQPVPPSPQHRSVFARPFSGWAELER